MGGLLVNDGHSRRSVYLSLTRHPTMIRYGYSRNIYLNSILQWAGTPAS